MRLLRFFVTLLLTLLLLLFLIETGVYMAASRTVLDAAFYDRLFDRAGVYDRLPEELARFVSQNAEIPEPFQGVSGEIAREIITPSRLREQVPGLLGAALSYVKGEADYFRLPVSLAKLRAPLEDSLARRLPPGLAGVARDAVAQLPDEYDVSAVLGPEVAMGMERLRNGVTLARRLAMITPVIALILAAAVWLISRRLSAVLIWLGATLIVAGLMVVAAALVPVSIPFGPGGVTPASAWLVGLDLPARIPGFDRQAAMAFLRSGMDAVVEAVEGEGLFGITAGAVLLASGLAGRRLSRVERS